MQAYVILHGTLGSSEQLSLHGQHILQAGQVDLFELHVDPAVLGPLLRITLGLKPEVCGLRVHARPINHDTGVSK